MANREIARNIQRIHPMFADSKSGIAIVNITYSIGTGSGFRSAKLCMISQGLAGFDAPIVARDWQSVQPVSAFHAQQSARSRGAFLLKKTEKGVA